MVKKTGPTNPNTKELIGELKKKTIEEGNQIWKRIATDLEKPTRSKRVVNLSSIQKNVNDNETIVVPGKVLGNGELDKKVNVAAFSFSKSAKEKLLNSNSQIISIKELMKKNPKTSEVRIIG